MKEKKAEPPGIEPGIFSLEDLSLYHLAICFQGCFFFVLKFWFLFSLTSVATFSNFDHLMLLWNPSKVSPPIFKHPPSHLRGDADQLMWQTNTKFTYKPDSSLHSESINIVNMIFNLFIIIDNYSSWVMGVKIYMNKCKKWVGLLHFSHRHYLVDLVHTLVF